MESLQGCEYTKEGCVPLKTGLKDGFSPVCSCGIGKIPETDALNKDVKPFSALIRKYATRAVISPIFAVPHVEPCFELPETLQRDMEFSELLKKATS